MAEAQGQPQAQPQPEPDPDELVKPAASGSVVVVVAAAAPAAVTDAAGISVEEGHGLPAVVSSLASATDPLAAKPPSQSQAQVSTPQTYGRVQVELHPQRLQQAEPQHQHHPHQEAHPHPQHHHHHQQQHDQQLDQEQLLQQQLRLEDAADVEAHTPSLYGVTEEAGAKEETEHNHNNFADANSFTPTTSTPSTSVTSTTTTTTSTTVVAEPISSVLLANGAALADEHQQSNGSLPPSPSSSAMSNPPQHPGHPRQPVGFPSPTYNSHGMNAHYGYGNPAGQAVDPYRGSPVSTPGHNPMSLPSMRTFDPVQQAQSQPGSMPQQMMQVQAGMSYYPQPVLPGNPYGIPPEAMGPRYVLPPNDPRAILSGPRGKKEIKRRTKTGCLTCRKRRIKCDEQHPVCKNCQKSKRECLGYDPIFKQQQQHPTNIQPAPNHPAPSISVPSNGPPPAAPSAALAGNAAAATYTSLPSVLSSSYNSSASSSVANLVPTIKSENFDYGPAIDPALDGVGPTSSTSASHFPAMKPVAAPSPLDQRTPITTPHLRGGGPPSVPLHRHHHDYHSASQPAPSPSYSQTPTYNVSPAKKMRVEELVVLGGASLPKTESPPSKEKLEEIQGLYTEIYAPGLESFFESKWFTKDYAMNALLGSAPVLDTLAGFLSAVSNTNVNDTAAMNHSANLEFRVVWALTCLAYIPEAPINNFGDLPAEDDAVEIRNRVAVMDALLAGDYLEHNPLQPPAIRGDYHRIREFEFWYNLAEFMRVKELPNADMTPQRDHILGKLRAVLDGRENRDVLYSIAVMRAYGPNFPPDFESTLPSHLDEGDPKSKLAVARKFIQDEAKVTGGTTNIVRRFSELAARAFISPGGNVPRRGIA